ncbi:uncharacterized protein LOC129220173 [Uloborus diversus]|uniref:uncharacterized protein LOC129220173 n=1 Tax=Uloborus diversus TaxID=327109 RepID=UPI0024093A5B|nr:uncharacterized protein LOC129220173 [Uloborus diversus]
MTICSLKMKRMNWDHLIYLCLVLTCAVQPGSNAAGPVYVPSAPRAEALTAAEDIDSDASLPTVTVRGFLNFRTTVDGTVIVFTPASGVPQDPTPASSIYSPPSNPPSLVSRNDDIQHLSFTNNDRDTQKRTELENEAHTPEDDRQNFRQRHLKPGFSNLGTTPDSDDLQEPQQNLQKPGATPPLQQYPTGLVTVLGGTHVKDGATTVFETKVIGTYIEGKYAQILQSTSQIIFPARPEDLSTPKPSPTKPVYQKSATATVASSRSIPTKPNKHLGEPSASRYKPTVGSVTKEYRATTVGSRQADRRTDEPLNSNTVLQSSFKLPEGVQNRQSTHPTESLEKTSRSSYSVPRRFRPTVVPDIPPEDENTVPESQNGRGGGRGFRYVLPRRNTPSVRLNRFKVKLSVRNDGGITGLVTPQDNTFDPDEEIMEEYDPLAPVDPAKVIYEKTTITSEVTLHVGRRKSIRTLTITTNVPKTRHIYPTYGINDAHDISPANNNAIFATLSPIDDDAVPQVVVTRTYTTTERMLKTSVVPISDNETTSYHTVTESFFILKLITGYKTLPASEMTMYPNETTETEFDESVDQLGGLLDGAVQLEPSPRQQIIQTPIPNGLLQASGSGREPAIVPYDQTKGKANANDLSNSLLSLGAALQQNPLAAVYLGLQQLNKHATLYSTITKTSTYVQTDIVYSTKVVSFYDGRRTRTRTLSESISTTEQTKTSLITTVEPYLNTQLFQQQNQLQQLLGGTQLGTGPQLIPPPPQYSTLTTTYTTVTTATSLSTRVYTLIYNAISTKFRTVTSTSLYETTVTVTSTSEVPIAITAPPGGVFPFLG